MTRSSKDYNKEHMARVIGRALPISTKQCIEICNFIRYKDLGKVKDTLNKITEKKVAVPFKRFRGIGHKRKIGPGRFPIKASKEILKLSESVEANAQFKGLDTSSLFIKHIKADKASKTWHYGRKRRKMKRTTVEIIVEERKKRKEKK